MIEGMFVVYNTLARILFDSGSTYSFISTWFASTLDLQFEPFEITICVAKPVGNKVSTTRVCKTCVISIADQELEADLIILDMFDYDVILGMYWLSKYNIL